MGLSRLDQLLWVLVAALSYKKDALLAAVDAVSVIRPGLPVPYADVAGAPLRILPAERKPAGLIHHPALGQPLTRLERAQGIHRRSPEEPELALVLGNAKAFAVQRQLLPCTANNTTVSDIVIFQVRIKSASVGEEAKSKAAGTIMHCRRKDEEGRKWMYASVKSRGR